MTMSSTMDSRLEDTFHGLSVHDQPLLEGLLEMRLQNIQASGLDAKTHALTRIASLIAMDGAPASFVWQVGAALEAGATSEEILGVLVAVGPIVGTARVVACAPEIAVALGMDMEGI
jgi:alkylhydroperoxidase/carboxymuconolactone decarboxylase family protein YurZ